MVKNVISVVVGYAAWTCIFLGGAAGVRSAMPAVFDAEGFTLDVAALSACLVISVVASFLAGWLTAKIAGSSPMIWGSVLSVCLLATGIPVQWSAWDKLPAWYNVTFLVLLAPVTMLGARWGTKSQPRD